MGPRSQTKQPQQRPETGPGGPTRDEVFDALSNVRRRYTVHYLRQREEAVELRDLSKQVAAWENSIDQAELSSQQRRRVYTALRQSHLPKLDNYGFIKWSADRGTIEPTEQLRDLRVHMEVLPGDEIPWSIFYTGLGGLFLGVVTAAAVGLVPFDQLSGLGWATVFALAFIVVGTVHSCVSYRNRIGSDGPPPSARAEADTDP